jgi:hypothetical protein
VTNEINFVLARFAASQFACGAFRGIWRALLYYGWRSEAVDVVSRISAQMAPEIQEASPACARGAAMRVVLLTVYR